MDFFFCLLVFGCMFLVSVVSLRGFWCFSFVCFFLLLFLKESKRERKLVELGVREQFEELGREKV